MQQSKVNRLFALAAATVKAAFRITAEDTSVGVFPLFDTSCKAAVITRNKTACKALKKTCDSAKLSPQALYMRDVALASYAAAPNGVSVAVTIKTAQLQALAAAIEDDETTLIINRGVTVGAGYVDAVILAPSKSKDTFTVLLCARALTVNGVPAAAYGGTASANTLRTHESVQQKKPTVQAAVAAVERMLLEEED